MRWGQEGTWDLVDPWDGRWCDTNMAAVLDVLELADPGDRGICVEGAELNQAWADKGWIWNGGSGTKIEREDKRHIFAEEKAQCVMHLLDNGKWKKKYLKWVPLDWAYGTEPCWLEEVRRLIPLPLQPLEFPTSYRLMMERMGWLCKPQSGAGKNPSEDSQIVKIFNTHTHILILTCLSALPRTKRWNSSVVCTHVPDLHFGLLAGTPFWFLLLLDDMSGAPEPGWWLSWDFWDGCTSTGRAQISSSQNSLMMTIIISVL